MTRRGARSSARGSLRAYARAYAPALVLAGAGLVIALWAFDPFGGPPPAPAWPPGTVAVPLTAVAIPAYSDVRIEHLQDPATGRLRVFPMASQDVLPTTFVRPEDVLGRVLAHDKPAGQVFVQSDFLPPGTRPGVAGGIPSDLRGMRLALDRVSGCIGLRPGDRFDLFATSALAPAQGAPRSGVAWPPGRSNVRALVEDGMIVTGIETRSVPTVTPSALGPGRTESRSVQEVVIAVRPDEVPAVTAALAQGTKLDCIPRSGRPNEDTERSVSTPTAQEAYGAVEMIQGADRSIESVPQAPRTPPPVGAAPHAVAR